MKHRVALLVLLQAAFETQPAHAVDPNCSGEVVTPACVNYNIYCDCASCGAEILYYSAPWSCKSGNTGCCKYLGQSPCYSSVTCRNNPFPTFNTKCTRVNPQATHRTCEPSIGNLCTDCIRPPAVIVSLGDYYCAPCQ